MTIFTDYITAAERIADDASLRTKRARAIAWLDAHGYNRGRPNCRHTYTTSAGERVEVSAKTMRELYRVKVLAA